jgi:hypothetical protein
MALDPSTIGDGIGKQGLAYICGLLVVAVIAEFGLLVRAWNLRLRDQATANERMLKLAESVIPTAKDLAQGVTALVVLSPKKRGGGA